ncbi:MAG: MBL fold metallo-hydrolase [Chitinivibrionia bacterium]|nr:MBL fold metallo-hydrolase [Chitinivibrionia bacterium]
MIFYQIPAGGDRNFAYLAGDADGGKGALFDPPPGRERYLPLVEKHQLEILYCVATHGHSDHTAGLKEAAETFKAVSVAHPASPVRPLRPVRDGDTLPLGALTLRFIHTPGHTDDSICILVRNKLVTGDTLFVGKVGGTDYGEQAKKEWDSFQRKILTLEDDIEVYPGHDYGLQPSSTIAREKSTNPFLLRKTFEEFLELKINWLQYKKEHGIP